MLAPDWLRKAACLIDERAQERGLTQERSMSAAVAAFNALTDAGLTELHGWLFMVCLKLSRATCGKPKDDDLLDAAAYCALALEAERIVREDDEKESVSFAQKQRLAAERSPEELDRQTEEWLTQFGCRRRDRNLP